jgi:hypothetical protein
MEKTCNKPGCDSTVLNSRTNYCCRSHQRSHAGSLGGIASRNVPKKKYKEPKLEKIKAEPRPKKTKEETIAYHRQWAIEKQKRTKQATPTWANKEAIKEVYRTAVELTESTGNKYEVDHIVPLTSKLVCGLHVEHNLRVITFEENRKKSNHFRVG